MSKYEVCACGPRSKNAMTGVALAFDLLISGLEASVVPYRVVDATFRGAVSKAGSFSVLRSFDTVLVIFMVWWQLLFSKCYYATMSTSPVGFVRDYLTVGFAKLLGRRTVLHLHGGGFEDFYTSQKPWLQKLIRSNLSRTDTIIVLGELLKGQFYCAGDFVDEKLVVVPNGLTLGMSEPQSLSKSLPTEEEHPIELLYLSSLMPSKGFYDVLQAMVVLNRQFPGQYHLNLCGSFVDAKTEQVIDVSNERELFDYLRVQQLEECVTYHGAVSGRAKELQYEKANVFLLPTSYPWEGQPLSIIEALSFSVPVISCCHKGIPELVEEEKTGVFVEPGVPEEIAKSIIRMVSKPQLYTAMSVAARKHYEANFRREVHLERLIQVVLP